MSMSQHARAQELLRRARARRHHPEPRAVWLPDVGAVSGDVPTMPVGTHEDAKQSKRARRVLNAWDNTSGYGETIDYEQQPCTSGTARKPASMTGRTRLRKMAQKNAHLNGTTCTSVGPIRGHERGIWQQDRMSWTQAEQHGMLGRK